MKTRIISGAVALVILAGMMALCHTVIFNIGFGLVGALAVCEIIRAEKLEGEYALIVASVAFALRAPTAVYTDSGLSLEGLPSVLLPYILSAFAYIVIATTILLFRHKSVPAQKFYLIIGSNLLISLAMTSLCGIVKLTGDLAIICLIFSFMGSWVADSGAYFAGTFFGKHKLCPEISPKKTVEGLIGGIITNAAAFALFTVYANHCAASVKPDTFTANFSPILFAAFGCICCLLGLIGDLTASLIKRECGIKDYGNIMPGHGGAMDRFDSVIYVAPFMLIVFASIG